MTTGQIALKEIADETHPFVASFVADALGKFLQKLPQDKEMYANLIEESTHGMVSGEQWANAAFKVKEILAKHNLTK